MKFRGLPLVLSVLMVPAVFACREGDRDRRARTTTETTRPADEPIATAPAPADTGRDTTRPSAPVEDRYGTTQPGTTQPGTAQPEAEYEEQKSYEGRSASATLTGFLGAGLSGSANISPQAQTDSSKLTVNVSNAPQGTYGVSFLKEDGCDTISADHEFDKDKSVGQLTVGSNGSGRLDTTVTSQHVNPDDLFGGRDSHIIVVHKLADTRSGAAAQQQQQQGEPGQEQAQQGQQGAQVKTGNVIGCGQVQVSGAPQVGG